MADYESTAYMSLERLKEQHGEELGKFQEMIRGSEQSEKGDDMDLCPIVDFTWIFRGNQLISIGLKDIRSCFQLIAGQQPARVKCSRELLELRRKQEALAKLGRPGRRQ